MLFQITAALAQVTAPSPSISVAKVDWDVLPIIETRQGPMSSDAPERAARRIDEIIRQKECTFDAATRSSDFHIRFATKINAAGEILELIVEPKNFRPLETLAAAFFLQPEHLRAVRSRGALSLIHI